MSLPMIRPVLALLAALIPAVASAQGAVGSPKGPADQMTVTPGPGMISRALSTRFSERPSVIDYGVDMTGVTDSAAAFTAALNSGKPITAPCGTIRFVSTVNVTAQASFAAAGPCTRLKYDPPAGSAAAPAIDIQPGAAGSRLDNFALDHQADTKGNAVGTVYGGNIIAGSAILVQADSTTITRASVSNAYDNCIAVIRLTSGGAAVPGSPKYYSLQGIRTANCGFGAVPKAGAGVDIGSGSQGTVNDLVDVGSYGAFILDVGAGAQGTFSNLTGINTKVDATLGYSYTFYIGSSDSSFTNLTSIGAGYSGLWLDGYTDNTTLNNVYVKAPAATGAKIKGGNSTISNLIVNSPGYGKTPGTVDAVEIDSSANKTNNLTISGLKVQSEFNPARYGINRTGTGPVTGSVLNADLSGAVTATNNLPATFGVVDGAALGGGWTSYTPTLSCSTGSLTTASPSGQARKVGRTVEVQLNLSLTTVGSCSGTLSASLPYPVSQRAILLGQETAVVGVGLVGTASEGGSAVQIKRYDGNGSAIIANGYALTLGGTYQTP